MSYLDEEIPLSAAIVFALLAFLFGLIPTIKGCEIGHEQLGSTGHACFANRTCRTYLTCYDAEGLDHPICVGPKR